MANTYRFKINAVDVYTLQDGLEKVIYNVHWSYIAEDENSNTVSMMGTQPISNPTPENFIPFEKLIQNDIAIWIEPLLDIETMQKNLDDQMTERLFPTKLTLRVPDSLETSE